MKRRGERESEREVRESVARALPATPRPKRSRRRRGAARRQLCKTHANLPHCFELANATHPHAATIGFCLFCLCLFCEPSVLSTPKSAPAARARTHSTAWIFEYPVRPTHGSCKLYAYRRRRRRHSTRAAHAKVLVVQSNASPARAVLERPPQRIADLERVAR